jgi:hypothetical protein
VSFRFSTATLLFITFLAALGMAAIGLVYRHAPDRFVVVVGVAGYCLLVTLMMVLPGIGVSLLRRRVERRKDFGPEPSEEAGSKSTEVSS